MLRILLIRKDNIGDLICTTPVFSTLRKHYPAAWIGVLANSYNAAVLAGNPDIDQVFAYRKAKHRKEGDSLLSTYLERLRLIRHLRGMAIDDVILAGSSSQHSAERFARWINPKRIIGERCSSLPHEVQQTYSVLRAYGIDESPPPCQVVPDPERIARLAQRLPPDWDPRAIVGVHISARKPTQRWPADRFAALMAELHRRHGACFLLFWSPGAPDNPLHPGDDEKAREILSACSGLPLLPIPTQELPELVAGLALVQRVVCSDGGAMHIAAGLGKPIVCFFGQSTAERWHPWGVRYELLQPESRDVSDILVADALSAFERLG